MIRASPGLATGAAEAAARLRAGEADADPKAVGATITGLDGLDPAAGDDAPDGPPHATMEHASERARLSG